MKTFTKTTICTFLATMLAFMPANTYAMSQDETVYAKLQPNGETSYTSVTKHLINDLRDNKLNDQTILHNIQNLNGFESYTLKNNNLSWNANGNDIYYSGETDQSLPISVEVTYKLNGESKTIDQILGQSGRVEINLKYHNLSKVGDLYTPFVVAVATTLPEASTHRIEVTNGKVISNGRNLAITAIAAPGLYESLQLNELKTLNTVTISYETEKFELNDIYSFVTPKLLDEDDLKIFNEVDKLSSDADKLSDSSKQLLDGINELRNGVKLLHDTLVETKSQLSLSGNLLDNTTLDQIAQAAANAAERQVIAKESTLRQQFYAQINQVPELAQLETIKASLSSAAPIIIKAQTTEQVQQYCTANPEVCADEAALATITQNINEQVTQQVMAQFNVNIDLDVITEKLFQNTLAAMKQTASTTAASTARSVATQVANSIQEGTKVKLTSMLDALISGVDSLLVGANRLSDGMQKFDAEGIQKLNNVVNGKLTNTSNKMKRLVKLSDDYNSFSGAAEGVKGETKFILMIEGKKA